MKTKTHQQEADFGAPEPFALVGQVARDGKRIARAKAQAEQDRQEAERRQPDLTFTAHT